MQFGIQEKIGNTEGCSGHGQRQQPFFQNIGKIVRDDHFKLSVWLSKKPDLNPKVKLKTCMGIGRPALQQLHQEG